MEDKDDPDAERPDDEGLEDGRSDGTGDEDADGDGVADPTDVSDDPEETENRSGFAALTLGAIGIVYGDIGTSPIYALREALHHAGAEAGRAEVFGIVSLLLWALILLVSLKYVLFLLRAHNKGEGGILALFSLARAAVGGHSTLVFVLGVAGAALFFGDAMVTPAISVLSAVEGLDLVTPIFDPYVVPIAIAILVLLFVVQRGGTGAVAAWFGPITAVWFTALGISGGLHLWDAPEILVAFNPLNAIGFLTAHGMVGFVVLGAVFLAATGAEALYADLGHFGARPIRMAWFAFVFPCLMLNYLGQGAMVLDDPSKMQDPFFLLVPDWALLPLVLLATIATVIASQAVITGAFSMTRQAVQLGLLPRLDIRHTSEERSGRIYMPAVNWLLLTMVLILVLTFRTSSNLASAYGIAVTGTMIVTTALAAIYMRSGWNWPIALVIAFCLPIAVVEAAFLAANLLKLPQGGYVPVLIAALAMLMMWTWWRGRGLLMREVRQNHVPLDEFIESEDARAAPVVPGTAIFLTGNRGAAPPALLHNLEHNRVLHEHVIILTVLTMNDPVLPPGERIEIERLNDRITAVELKFGFMETPDVSMALARYGGELKLDMNTTSFFLGRRNLVADARYGMPIWQDRIFLALANQAADQSDFYHLPRGRVLELGTQLTV